MTETAERLVTGYDVMVGNPTDSALLIAGLIEHVEHTGRMPDSVATDRGFWSSANEDYLRDKVKRASLPYRGKRSAKRTAHERQPWFRRLQRWRAGQEGTISVLKRRYGIDRTLCCRLSAVGGRSHLGIQPE